MMQSVTALPIISLPTVISSAFESNVATPRVRSSILFANFFWLWLFSSSTCCSSVAASGLSVSAIAGKVITIIAANNIAIRVEICFNIWLSSKIVVLLYLDSATDPLFGNYRTKSSGRFFGKHFRECSIIRYKFCLIILRNLRLRLCLPPSYR